MPQRSKKHIARQHKKARKDPFEYIIYFFTVATPLFEIPQAITIYARHNAGSVSIYTWSFFLIDNIVWIIYGFRKKLKPLFVTSVLYFIIEVTVVIGIIRYS
jgi:uncharacterized protein with PQ loop repeat